MIIYKIIISQFRSSVKEKIISKKKKTSRSLKTDRSTDLMQIITRLDEILQSFNRRSIDLH